MTSPFEAVFREKPQPCVKRQDFRSERGGGGRISRCRTLRGQRLKPLEVEREIRDYLYLVVFGVHIEELELPVAVEWQAVLGHA